jgi:hypothetical protein
MRYRPELEPVLRDVTIDIVSEHSFPVRRIRTDPPALEIW